MGKHVNKRVRAIKPTFAGQKPIKQKIWEYMRRNPIFFPTEIRTIIEGSDTTLRGMINYLENAGYIQRVNDERRLKERCYRLAKDTGKYAPMYNKGKFYDFNTGHELDLGARVLLKGALKESSMGDVAKRLDISKSTVSLIVAGKYPNPEHMYNKIRQEYGA